MTRRDTWDANTGHDYANGTYDPVHWGDDGDDEDDGGDDEYWDWLWYNESERHALLFDAGSVPVMHEPQPDRREGA